MTHQICVYVCCVIGCSVFPIPPRPSSIGQRTLCNSLRFPSWEFHQHPYIDTGMSFCDVAFHVEAFAIETRFRFQHFILRMRFAHELLCLRYQVERSENDIDSNGGSVSQSTCPVLLFCRQEGEPYVFCGQLRCIPWHGIKYMACDLNAIYCDWLHHGKQTARRDYRQVTWGLADVAFLLFWQGLLRRSLGSDLWYPATYTHMCFWVFFSSVKISSSDVQSLIS